MLHRPAAVLAAVAPGEIAQVAGQEQRGDLAAPVAEQAIARRPAVDQQEDMLHAIAGAGEIAVGAAMIEGDAGQRDRAARIGFGGSRLGDEAEGVVHDVLLHVGESATTGSAQLAPHRFVATRRRNRRRVRFSRPAVHPRTIRRHLVPGK